MTVRPAGVPGFVRVEVVMDETAYEQIAQWSATSELTAKLRILMTHFTQFGWTEEEIKLGVVLVQAAQVLTKEPQ